jgi:hypothetical protein
MTALRYGLLLFALLWLLPIAASAVLQQARNPIRNWWAASRASAGLLPPAREAGGVVRVFAAPTVSWRGVVAVHSWIVFKEVGAPTYTRYDYTAWGEPIRMNGFEPDGLWFGRVPEVVFAADGAAAEAMIPHIRAAIADYAWRNRGDYRAWPGPNSNTFVRAVMDAVPGIGVTLPPTAIGKDYPYDGRWLRPTPSRTGFQLSLGGYAGVTFGWVEGVEVNVLGGVVGLDLRRPALKLPGLGRIGMRGPDGPGTALPDGAVPSHTP